MHVRWALAGLLVMGLVPASPAQDKEASVWGKTVSQWVEELGKDDEDAQIHALRALMELGPSAQAALPNILEALKGPNLMVGMSAVIVVPRVDPAGTRSIVPVTRTLNEWARGGGDVGTFTAVLALYGPVARSAVPTLTALFKSTEDEDARMSVAAALGIIAGPEALLPYADDDDGLTRMIARHGLYGAYAFRAWAKAMEGDLKVAISQYGRADRYGTVDPEPLTHKAVVRILNGQRERGIEDLQEAVELDPEFAEDAALWLAGLGAGKEALQKIDPFGVEENLKRFYLGTLSAGELIKAAPPDQDFEQDDYVIMVRAHLGLAAEREGRQGDALRHYRFGVRRPHLLHVSYLWAHTKLDQAPGLRIQGRPVIEWIAHLKGEDPGERTRAVHALSSGEVRTPEVIRALIDLLGSDDPSVVTSAASGLGQIGPGAREAIPALMPHVGKNWLAGWALARIGADPKSLVPRLVELLGHEDDQIRYNSAFAIREFGARGAAAVPALLKAFKEDKAPKVRNTCVQALAMMGREAQSAVPTFVELLKHPDQKVRTSGFVALAKMGPNAEAATGELMKIVKEGKDPINRLYAAWALAGVARSAPSGLSEALKDTDARVRTQVIKTLGRIGTEADGDLLIDMATSKDQAISRAASNAIGQAAFVPRLIKALREGDETKKLYAVSALSRIGRPARAAVPDLVEALQSDSKRLRMFAAGALSGMGTAAEPAVPALIESLKEDDAALLGYAVRALGAVGPPAAAAKADLVRLLTEGKHPKLQGPCAVTLLNIGAVEAVKEIVRGNGPMAARQMLSSHYQREVDRLINAGEFDKAVETCSAALEVASRSTTFQLRTAIALALKSDRDAALKASESAPVDRLNAIWVALLGGGTDRLRGIPLPADWTSAIARYVLGRATEDELFAEAKGNPHKLRQAHTYIGLRSELRGRPDRALRAYQRALLGGQSASIEFLWSRVRVRQRTDRVPVTASDLGFRWGYIQRADRLYLPIKDEAGLVVTGVDDSGPAANAGLEIGDVIVVLDGEDAVAALLNRKLAEAKPGASVRVELLRRGEVRTIDLSLSAP